MQTNKSISALLPKVNVWPIALRDFQWPEKRWQVWTLSERTADNDNTANLTGVNVSTLSEWTADNDNSANLTGVNVSTLSEWMADNDNSANLTGVGS